MSKQTIIHVAVAIVAVALTISILGPTAGGIGQLLALKIFTLFGVI